MDKDIREEPQTVGASPSRTGQRPGDFRLAAWWCASLGTAGWLVLSVILDRGQQSEQLARFFAAFLNQVKLGIIGIPATILLIVSLWLIRGSQPCDLKRVRRVRCLAWFGILLGCVVVLFYASAIVA